MQKEAEKPFEKHHTTKERVQGQRYCRAVKEFLQTYKTKKCSLTQEHNEQHCLHYHSPNDRRRNPYTTHSFAYYPTPICTCGHQKCSSCHNMVERNFHPLAYKLQKCNNYYDCRFNLQCPLIHAEDEPHFQMGEYFRFDITLFKTKPCPRKEPHERKVCLYYHNEKDRRRGNFEAYSHIPCHKQSCNCAKSHNKIEQLYHPSRYKSKFCQTYGSDPLACEYRDFCSFAHTREEITIDLLDETNKDPNYLAYNYKTIWCPYTLDHDRGNCPYAHNFQDYRRNPKDYKYSVDKCDAWNFNLKIESIEQGGCKAGMGCGKCHGWMEDRYHPLVYPPKRKHYSVRHDPFEKKVAYNHKRPSKKEKEKNVEAVHKNIEAIANKNIQTMTHKEIQQKATKFAVGAPFFKSDRDKSSTSKKTNTKTGYVESDKTGNAASDKSCNEDQSRHEVGSQLAGQSPITNENDIWHFDNEEEGKVETRSKSQGNSSDFVPSYSHTIKDVFRNDNILMEKLVKGKVNEITLINADEKKIDNMSFLNSKEKERLVNKLKQYSLKKDIGFIEYSQLLTRFFVRNHADHILQKLRNKKVNQTKIMKLQSRQATKDCSFLEEHEKELLPKLLKKYQQELEFGSIMHSVQRYIAPSTDDSYFNDDK